MRRRVDAGMLSETQSQLPADEPPWGPEVSVPLVPQQGHWACQTFKQSLGDILVRNEWISADCTGFYVGKTLSRVIQQGIEDLISSAAEEGWEPAENAEIENLFRQGRIELDYHDYFVMSSVKLRSVGIRFKRWVEHGSRSVA